MHQYLFFIGSFPIRAYGLLLSLGIISAALVAWAILKRDGRGWEKHVADMAIYCGLAGIVGARLWDVFFFDWHYYGHHLLEIPYVWQGGMAIQGGIILGTIVGILYCRKHNIPILPFADLVAPSMILGQSIGRMANLMNGDAFGHPTGGDFGILYPSTTLAYHTYGNQPLWPAEIWEGQLDVLIFVVLFFMLSRKHSDGQIFALYIFLYSLARFFLEYLRGDYHTAFLGLKSAQVTSLTEMIVAVIAFIGLHYYAKYTETK